MSSKNNHHTYAISYGLFSGKAHGKRLRAAMKKAGYTETENQEAADFIIAHSAGCWHVKPSSNTKLIVYVGMPMALEKPLKTWYVAVSTMFRSIPGSLDKAWLRYVARHNIGFMITQPLRNLRIIRNAKKPHPLSSTAPSIMIINQDDAWTHSSSVETYIQRYNWGFVGLPGSHDDIWQHPDHIVAIINHHAGLLAQTKE